VRSQFGVALEPEVRMLGRKFSTAGT
jgi:hypothetical protein